MKSTTKDRDLKTAAELFPAAKSGYCAVVGPIPGAAVATFQESLKSTGLNPGFQWLLSSEPAPAQLTVPTLDEITLSEGYLAAGDKVDYTLSVRFKNYFYKIALYYTISKFD